MTTDVEDFLEHHGAKGQKWDVTSTPTDDILEHFGVKGMKWGVRRDPSGSHGGGEGAAKKDPLKDVTDEDLRKMVSRLQMEQQFRTLSEKTANKTAIDHGAAFVHNIVGPAVKVAIAGAITARVASALKDPSKVAKVAKTPKLSLSGKGLTSNPLAVKLLNS